MLKKNKIVLIGENGSVHFQRWVNAIRCFKEVELHIITFNRGVQYDGVQYHYLIKKLSNRLDFLLNVNRVKKLIKNIKPDIVHAHYATSYGFLGAMSGFHPLIITGWGADIFDSPQNPVMKKLVQYSLNKADAVTVLSKITETEIKKLTDKKIDLIPFGVDINKFQPSLKKDKTVLRIGTIRTLTEKYGIEYLIKAFAIVCKKHENLLLDIVGDGPLMQNLKSLCIQEGVNDKVIFHGYVNQNTDFNTYISLLQQFDVFVILSVLDSETFGVAAVEAGACSIPVVATSVGGLPEVVEHEYSGLIVPPRDVAATAQSLERLVSDASLRSKLGENGRMKAEKVYNWKKNINQMMALYSRVLKGKEEAHNK